MAKGNYVGIDNIARKVKKAYVGVDGVARKVKSGYIGVNGIARRFYSSETLIPFSACPFPTNFDGIGNSGKNDYGSWTIRNSGTYSTGHPAKYAFDVDTGTYWRSTELGSDGIASIELRFPVRIKPSVITVISNNCGTGSCVQGYNPETASWVTIGEVNKATDFIGTELRYSGNEYFSAIRLYATRFSSSYTTPEVSDFKITSGIILM